MKRRRERQRNRRPRESQLFERIRIYLHYPLLSHGQLYVAFSRARSMAATKLKVADSHHQGKRDDKTTPPTFYL